MNDIPYLRYIGAGSFFPDVPARDLTKKEAEYHGIGRLLDSRLYERVEQKNDTQYVVAELEETQPKKRGK